MVALSPRQEFLWISAITAAAYVVSFFGCHDIPTWALESFPVAIGLALAWFYPLIPSRLLGRLLLLHALLLIAGAHWTYARVPLGFYFQDLFHFSRNHYDRFGHLLQGIVPAYIAREILLRRVWVSSTQVASAMGFACAVAFSAFYELLEWWVALLMGAASDAFLGTQGDPWDTQSDIAFAAFGALLAMTVFARAHDRSLARL